ncbi:MFS general substrate transporter [Athelia psychrophila]|uniref:MFS general substrate transporter n=1 Tax=Athelia psychrophila TaxID=1759441 RepID=A0A166JFB7_9AGAM|nr:MFS general substrate transporter [Fibularhizoctonia sp. CBS 109695]
MSTRTLSQRPVEIELSKLSLRAESSNNNNNTVHSDPQPPVEIEDVPPEGGYGWVVVAACSTITFLLLRLPYSWGLIQAKLAAEHLAADSTLAFIGSTATAFVSFGAIINTRLIRLIGSRNAALIACTLLGSSQVLSGWATHSVGALFVTNGAVLGMGCSICFMACGSLPGQYFKQRRGLANGCVFAGGGIGGFVLTFVMNALLSRVSVAWTFRILGFITLAVTLPAAMLLKERTVRPIATIDWTLFTDPKFLLLFFGSGIATFPLLVPPFFIPLYASSIGLSTSTGATLLAMFNLSSAFGRIGFGQLGDKIGPITSLSIAMIMSALSMLAVWPVSVSLAPFVVFVLINGVGNGGFFSTIPSVVGHMYGPKRLPTALSMIVTAWGAGYMMGAPVAGYILERYGGTEAGRAAFRPAMYYGGSMSLGSAMFMLTLRGLMTKKFIGFA